MIRLCARDEGQTHLEGESQIRGNRRRVGVSTFSIAGG